MTDNEVSVKDKSLQGFSNALNNLPLLISVFTGKTSMLLRRKPTDSEEAIFLDNLKVFLAANAKKITDMLLWMLPNEIEVNKIKIDTDANTGKFYFDDLAQAVSDALATGITNLPLTESPIGKRGVNVAAPKIIFELTNCGDKSNAEIKAITDKLCEEFKGEYELSIKVKL